MKKIFTLLVTALVLGTGSVMAEDISISSESEWKTFVSNVNGGTNYSGSTVTLTADITVTADYSFVANCLVGNSETNSFQGTFDGQGHTITFVKDAENIGASEAGPFRFIKNATIKNLKTAGTLKNAQNVMGGIVAQAFGTCTITNCMSSMNFTKTGTDTNDATFGGILGRAGDNSTGSITIKNCLYTGTLNANKSISGIVGYVRSNCTVNISNTLFAGTLTSEGVNKCNFYRSGGTCNLVSNCYRITNYDSQGTDATSANLLNGSIACTLASADDTNNTLFWGQGNLNKSNIDAYPSLTNDAAKKVVQVDINGMGTKPYVNPGGAAPNPCRFGKTGFKLDSGDAYSLETMPTEGGTFTYGTSKLETTTGMYCITLPAAAMTIVLPFDCDLPSGITAYDISYTSGDKVTATSVTKITANKPVLINGTAGTKYKFAGTFAGTYDGTLTDGVKAHTNGVLTGVYVDANASSGYNPIAYVPQNSYVLQNGASGLGFYKVNEANKIKITSFRAYATFDYSGSREFLGIDFNGNTTGVNEMKTQETNNAPVYSLSGQRVGSDYKGVVIQNGKKFVVK